MTQPESWNAKLATWQTRDALPLWAGVGIDAATGTTWEALDHAGQPVRDLNRRQRVQFRQANVFANSTDAHVQNLGWQMFRRTMDHGFNPKSGYLATWVDPKLRQLDEQHDLYDLTFAVLAAASLGKAGFDAEADIQLLERALDLLRAPVGWFETPKHRLPRRQNPHMHLFEASTALFGLTGATSHLSIAQECLDIIATHAMTPNGSLLEFFGPDWIPVTDSEQAMEPGHLAEWIYLADSYKSATGTSTGLPLGQMWDTVLSHRLPSGFLPDVVGQTSRRLWPQTEFLKAALVMQRAGYTLSSDTQPEQIAGRIWQGYMNTPVAGGWYDQFEDTSGQLTSTNMPASTFYHIDLAIRASQDGEA